MDYANVAETLAAARQKITTPGTWITGQLHKLKKLWHGGKYEDTYCAVGVINATATDTETRQGCFNLLAETIPTEFQQKYVRNLGTLADKSPACMYYNDQLLCMEQDYSTAHALILDLFDKAIALARAKAEEEKPVEITQNVVINMKERELVSR